LPSVVTAIVDKIIQKAMLATARLSGVDTVDPDGVFVVGGGSPGFPSRSFLYLPHCRVAGFIPD